MDARNPDARHEMSSVLQFSIFIILVIVNVHEA